MDSPTTLDTKIRELLRRKPELIPPPDGLWESIHATWTGLWTDFHGEWDERQPSDIFPVSDFLSDEREESLVNDIRLLVQEENPLLNKLKAIKQEAYADIFNTYDYNIIAERVLELLGEYEEKENGKA